MPTLSLDFWNKENSVVVSGSGEGLDLFLLPPGEPTIVARLGNEVCLRRWPGLTLWAGETFKTAQGSVQGLRYLLNDETGVVGCLNITKITKGRRSDVVASNVFVAPQARRRGVATALFERARSDYPNLLADNSLTLDGAALLGVQQRNTPGP